MGTTLAANKGSITLAMLWMFLLSLLLFWLPLIGPFIAGAVGGHTAGSAGRGFLAAILPSAAIAASLFVFGAALTGLPAFALLAGTGVFMLMFFQGIPLIAGALIGGLLR